MTLSARALVAVAMTTACASGTAPSSRPDASAMAVDAGEAATLPDDLEATGLHDPDVRAYTPALAFWSDGSGKQRWIRIPAGTKIDTAKTDAWVFPVGTKAWKQFAAPDGHVVETRFFWKVRADRWLKTTYDGATGERATGDVVTTCDRCHRGSADGLLGFEPVSLGLAGASGVTLASLAAEGWLTDAPPSTALAIPDDGTGEAAAALGWLHVNCGTSCHNGSSNAAAYGTQLRLRLSTSDLSGEDLRATAIGVAARTPKFDGAVRVVPGDPDQSLLVRLATTRGVDQMPPLGTGVVDEAGFAHVRSWIAALHQPGASDAGAP